MVIKLDIDGVLRNMEDVMAELYNNMYGTTMTGDDIVDYDVDISFPRLRQDGIDAFRFFFIDHAIETMTAARQYKGAWEAVNKLREMGNVIKIVSYQPSLDAKLRTLSWLELNSIKYDQIIFTNNPDKTGVDCDMIIDDCPKYLLAEPAHVKKICINHKYNEFLKDQAILNMLHFNSLKDFVSTFES